MITEFDHKPEQQFRATESETFFTWNVEEVTKTEPTEDGETTERTAYRCEMVKVDGEPTFDKVFEKVIRERYTESEEFALVNAYNAHVTGVQLDEDKVEEYKEMLTWRQAKKDELKAVFEGLN